MVTYVVIGIMIILLIVVGVSFMRGKGAYLIAGFNTLPKAEQEQYDVPALTSFIGKSMFMIAFSLGFFILGEFFDKEWLFTVGMALMIVIVIYMIVYANTKNRFKKDKTSKD